MPREIQTTEIRDKDGQTHVYETVPYEFDKGIDLKLRILKVIVKPLGDALGELFTAQGASPGPQAAGQAPEGAAGPAEAPEGPEAADVADPGDSYDVRALDAMNWAGLGDLLEQIPDRLIAGGGSKLIAEILAETRRITPGEKATDSPTRINLREPRARDAAYSGGNWPECLKACAWILGVNYSPFSTGDSSDWKATLSGLRDLLPLVRGEG